VGDAFSEELHKRAEGPDADALLATHGASSPPATVVFEVVPGQRMPAGIVRKALVVVAPPPPKPPPAPPPPPPPLPAPLPTDAETSSDAAGNR